MGRGWVIVSTLGRFLVASLLKRRCLKMSEQVFGPTCGRSLLG